MNMWAWVKIYCKAQEPRAPNCIGAFVDWVSNLRGPEKPASVALACEKVPSYWSH